MSSVTKDLITILPFLWKGKNAKRIWMIFVTVFFVFLTIFLNLSVPIIFKEIVNALIEHSNVGYRYTFILLISYGACWAFGRFFEKIQEMIFFRPVSSVITEYSLKVFEHVHSLSLKFHSSRATGKVAGAIGRSQLAVAMLITNIIFRIVPVFIEILFAFLILWLSVGIEIGLIVVAILIVYLATNYFIMGLYKKANKKYQDLSAVVDKRLMDSLLNSESIKYLGAEGFETHNAGKLIRERENSIVKLFWVGTMMTVFQALLLGSGLTLISYLVGVKVLAGQLNVGDFVLANGYLLLLFNPLESMAGLIIDTIYSSVKLKHSIALLSKIHKIEDVVGARDIKIKNAEIDFKNISFHYDDRRRNILENFSLHVPEKSTVAIVGPTGSGKSTITRLIFRFYDVVLGSILIDGQDISAVTKRSLRKQIAVVPQDIVLLNKSLKYNISYGNFDVSDDDINNVVKAVHLDKLISELPLGLETLVGERGVKLSGGERQRIAIARALLKKPKILIFDEATSSLDTRTEKIIQDNIDDVTKNITTVLIAHRLSTVVHADQIVVLDKGKIAEKGNHQELLSKEGVYCNLWRGQHDKK